MQPGTVLGPYRIGAELGAGGMGQVWAATATADARAVAAGTRVALKIVHPHLLETPGFFKRFLREAEIGRAVRHANVVRTLDCDSVTVDGRRCDFIAMEYVEGQTLRGLQEELERVPEDLCRHIGREVAQGLAAIHAAGVIHRDLKPENVLITPDHVVKVMDLGVARLMDEAVRLSQTGAFVGSLQYAAPEQFRSGEGARIDGRADLHALGLVLYELATGAHPFVADSVPEIVQHVLHTRPRKIGEVLPQLSAFFEGFVDCLLAKDPARRLVDADAVAVALARGEDAPWWKTRAAAIRAETRRPLRRIRIPRETAVFGRDAELARLRARYDQARTGLGQVVVIDGEAGIGKTRLVDELMVRLHADGEDLNFLFGGYTPGGAATAAGGFSSAYREQLGEAGSAAYLSEIPLLAPAFDAVLRGEPSPPGEVELAADSLGTCFVHATRSLAAERPTVVLIEDLHFAPREARALFSALATAIAGHRVLLVATTRPGHAPDWLAQLSRLDHVEHMEVGRLGPKDLTSLLLAAFGSQHMAQGLGFRIAQKSDGNPFFVFEILRGLRDGKAITQRPDGSWVTTQVIEEIEIPSTVRDLVNARIADLDEEDHDLLEVASCWGFRFDPVLVATAAGVSVVPALKRFGRIEKKYRLVRAAGREVVFDHHQVQETLYAGILEQLREHYHAALAEALEQRVRAADADPETLDGDTAVDLCEHFLRGAGSDRADRYLEAAQAHLTAAHLHEPTADICERALAVPGLLVGVRRAETLLRLGAALDRLGRRARQEEAVREAMRLAADAGDTAVHVRAAQSLGAVLWRTARYDEAESVVRERLELTQTLGDREAEAAALGNLGTVLWTQGQRAEARELIERAVALARECGARSSEAATTGNLGAILAIEGRAAEALVLHERHLELARELGDLRAEAIALGHIGNLHKADARPVEARRCQERALSLVSSLGDRRSEAIATGNLGVTLRAEGHIAEALAHLEQCAAVSAEIGYLQGEAVARHNLGLVQCNLGDTARAEECFNDAVELCSTIGLRGTLAATHVQLGALRAAQGDEAGAREQLILARDVGDECGAFEYATIARCHLACLPGGDAQEAVRAVGEYEDRLDAVDRRLANWLLWRATDDATHLAEAKRLADECLAGLSDDARERMLRADPTLRAITRASADQEP